MLGIKTKITSWIAIGILCFNTQAQVVNSGSETKVNTTTENSQQFPSVAMDSTGNYTVAWESFDETNNNWEIHLQMYNSDGAVNGSETEKKAVAGTDYRYPSIAMTETGVQTMVYMRNEDGVVAEWDAYWSFYNADGSNIISETRITSSATNHQGFPDVAAAKDGSSFIAVCTSLNGDTASDIIVRQKNSGYATTSSSVTANTSTGNLALYPKVAVHTDGNFIVVWQYETGDASNQTDIYGQLFDTDRNKIGSEFVVNSTKTGMQTEPDVAFSDDGTFMVVWTSLDQDGSGQGIYRQRFDAAGTAIGGETLVNTATSNFQNHPFISATHDGYYNITWSSYDQDGSRTGVYYQALKGDGTILVAEEKINTRTADFQHFGEVAQTKHDSLAVVVWQDGLRNSTSSHDGEDYGVYLQMISNKDIVDPVADCQNITVYLNADGYALIDSADVDDASSDNFGSYTVDLSKDSVTCADIGIVVGTMTVTDLAGNTDACSYAITVIDTLAPNVVGQNLTVYLDGNGSATITAGDIDNGSTDNCSISSLTIDSSSFDCSELGANTVKLFGEDASGNKDSVTVTVTVNDTVSPVLSVQNLTVYIDGAGSASVNSSDFVVASSDNCSLLSTLASDSVYDCAQTGIFKVGVTALDVNGNSTTDSATVTLLDTVSPSVNVSNISAYLNASGYVLVSASDVDNGSTDNCSLTNTLSDSTFTCSDVGANVVTFTSEDPSGNTSSSNVTITILDTISPVQTAQLICEGDSLLIGSVYRTTSGAYNDTLTSVHSCDSIITINLSVKPVYSATSSLEICEGDSISIFGVYQSTAGAYVDTLTTSYGCDSVLTVNLSLAPSFYSSITESICEGETYSWRGDDYAIAGTYHDSLTKVVVGCDSVYELVLEVTPTYFTRLDTGMCSNDSILWRGAYYKAGTHYDSLTTLNTGCDSVFMMIVETIPVFSADTVATICSNSNISWRGNTYSAEGTYSVSYTSVLSGCDSIYNLTINHLPTTTGTEAQTICAGSSYVFGGQTLSSTGVYNETFTGVNGCDSVVTLTLTVNSVYNETANAEICEGASYSFGSQTLTTAGVFNETFTSVTGCDSVVALTLTVNPVYNETANAEICEGSSYSFGSQTLTTAGVFNETFTSVSGCDSVVALTLTVNPVFNGTANAEICEGDSYSFGSQTLTTSGVFNETYSSVAGCDSTITLTLNVIDAVETFDTITVLTGTVVSIHGVNEDQEGTYSKNFTSVITGCDSVSNVTLQWDVVTGVTENVEISVNLFPNPSNGIVNVEIKGSTESLSYKVYDELGKVVLVDHFSSETFKVDLSRFENGIYYIKIFDSEKQIGVNPIVLTK